MNWTDFAISLLTRAGAFAAFLVTGKTDQLIEYGTGLVGSLLNALQKHGVAISPSDIARWQKNADERDKILSA